MATKTRQLADFLVAGGVSDAEIQSVPHIKPGTLYPAVEGKDLDGVAISTSHGSTYTYGTTHTDGRMYYYTDIKGSKPIKDPRIGSHFGSQRHKFKSIQLLEQETATHGKNVYSVDGRENIRIWGSNDLVTMVNDSSGLYINSAHTCQSTIEVVGYFSGINILGRSLVTSLVNQGQLHYIDGVALNSGAEQTDFETSASSPLGGRYVDNANLVNVTTTQTLGIHTFTLKEHTTSEVTTFFGVELIAQDTSSTANKSKIQIPAQNVVSYGKKFAIPATAQHYDPFNGFTSGSSVTAYVDTATSLGVEGWKNSSTYYRPYNGGRVVRWVDSSGVIKTSVNMMPPNARSIGNSATLTNATAKANASIANNTFYPTMEAGAIDHSQAEVAKTFHWREFGNGGANQGTEGSYADASMLDNYDDIAYVMDDGLTSLSADDVNNSGGHGLHLQGDGDDAYITFIGTGVALKTRAGTHGGTDSWKWHIDGVEVKNFTSGYVNSGEFLVAAQNLPYGTHILQVERVTANTFGHQIQEVSFHQPKMPPIPEDAVVIADYMLMADYVANTANGNHLISKGVRVCSHTRDVYYKDSHGFVTSLYDTAAQPGMGYICSSSNTSNTDQNEYSLPAFGTTFQINGHTSQSANDLHIDGTDVAQSGTSAGNHGDISYPDASVALGLHKFGVHGLASNDYSPYISGMGFKIASPIHTSSHYQTFETPFLHELVGGDRNMEQTNLVVTPDGKSWDEVTRDVSYIGKNGFQVSQDNDSAISGEIVEPDIFRGKNGERTYWTKGWAIAYDRMICLEDGWYLCQWGGMAGVGEKMLLRIHKNGNTNWMVREFGGGGTARWSSAEVQQVDYFVRGDYLQFYSADTMLGSDQNYITMRATQVNEGSK